MEQRSEEWYRARRGRITGSVAGALLGLSPFMSAQAAFKRLKNPDGDSISDNPILAYGRGMEPHAIAMLELELGERVAKCGFFEYEDWLGASPDGFVGNDAVVEVKCPWSLANDADPQFKSAIDQPHYYAQMQIEILCADVDWCHFYQYANGKSRYELVKKDQAWLDENIPKLRQIWLDAFSEEVNPVNELVDSYFALSDEIKQKTQEKKELLSKIVEACGNKPGLVGGAKLSLTKKAGAVSYAKIVTDMLPFVDIEAYRGEPTEFWSIKR